MDSNFKFFTLFVMRGLPGSGKTTIAQSILGGNGINKTVNNLAFIYCDQGVICSSDFYSGHDKIQKSQKSVEFAMINKVPAIALDENNLTQLEIGPFISLANRHQYKVVVIEIPTASVTLCAENNTHGYNKEELIRMKGSWEKVNLPGTNGGLIKEETR